jgi:hypothetical protein
MPGDLPELELQNEIEVVVRGVNNKQIRAISK